MQEEKKTMSFFLRFFFRKCCGALIQLCVHRNSSIAYLLQAVHCGVVFVVIHSHVQREIRARSSTFRVCVAENSMVVQQSARCGHHDVDPVGEPLGLSGAVAAPHDQPEGVHVMLDQLLQHTIGLHRQLACGREDHHSCAWGLRVVTHQLRQRGKGCVLKCSCNSRQQFISGGLRGKA
ncbi:hypothetical protein F7725_001572 [Dissostichus mawsoni]|uniref:Uncharacterized protein n=1 Tax=Dissostichus mawsoni TaxID=36200 RepID=A0A7J5Y0Y6_DISMA|nr:hypothetical protein F7725_001572 [Dissostichus mawsoni]